MGEHIDDVLEVSVEGAVAVVTMDRPHKRNALDGRLLAALGTTLRRLDDDPGVGAVVLTGRDPAFCAGLDLVALSAGELAWTPEPGQRGPVPPMVTPLIGAVNGPAVTGGLEVALACDFLVASERATFADTHARVGVMPGWGLSVLLPQAIGVRRARQLSFTGNYLDARMAYEWGLVNEVVEHHRLVDHCCALATDIADAPRSSVQFLRDTYQQVTAGTVADGWSVERARAMEWQRDSDLLASLAERRQGIIERGRAQQG